MNIYAVIILSTLILGFLLDFIADKLNLKNLGIKLPDEFIGVYSEDSYKKSQQYTRVLTNFGFIVSSFSLAIMLIFWFAGGFNWLDKIVSSWFINDLIRGLIYIGILVCANAIIGFPFSVYSTFVIEEKFGFNKTIPKTFILDIIKSLGLGILLGAPLLLLVLYILQFAGTWAWLYGWGAVIIISLIIQFIAPKWILPLFNKFVPLQDGELKEAILNYADSIKYPVKNIYVMDGSKRSSKSNAFFTGFGKNKRIALFDTLIEKHTTDEIVSILAHEIGHFKKKHILKGMVISILHFGILFYLLSLFLHNQDLFKAFYMEKISIYTGLIFFGMLYTPVEMILSILMNIFSRKNEYQADNFAVQTTSKPESMISALKKLSETNLSNLTPHPFYVFINYSHPPVLERILAIRNFCGI
ncbi:MAG: M48 family metallopeptidase [FCB group bacterium]|jgi:STE24 endopeptidase